MRKTLPIVLLICMLFSALACEITIPGNVVSTLEAGGELVATEVAKALTSTALAAGGPAVTPGPSGGGPSDTAMPGVTPAETSAPTAALPHLRVAFISGGSPWLAAPPAAAYQLSTSTGVDSVDISDDGQMVAYIRHNTYSEPAELRVVNWDGTADRTLLSPVQVGALEATPTGALFVDLYQVKWIPGTHRLLINTKAQYEGPGLPRLDDLLALDVDTGTLTTIFTAGNAGEVWPSPDGTKMAISRATFISMAGIDGSGIVSSIITFPSILTHSEYAYYPEIVWKADSSQFGVIIASEDPLTPPTTGAIWLVNASTGSATLASTLNGNFFFPHAVLSPTLDHVGYVVETSDPSVKDSYVSVLDGSSSLHLGTGNTGVDTFSPDGQWFSYYVGSGTDDYIGSLGGGTVLVPGGAMRLMWYGNTGFIYASGTYAAWTLKMGDTGGGSSVIATPTGDRITFDADE
jgi:hypothetical protein